MSYKSLMVHLELGRPNDNLLQFAAELSRRHESRIIGIAACGGPTMVYGDIGLSGNAWVIEREQIEDQMATAETQFKAAFPDRSANVEWRSATDCADLAHYVAHQARCADLLLTGVAQGDLFDASRTVNTGALVMQAGRPVLLVPQAAREVRLARVLLAWKDTRETRRAVADALPLMRQAEVSVVEVARPGSLEDARRHLDDVVTWLMRHGIAARALPLASSGDDSADLHAAADRERADVIVAGAYGHNRLREWILGGVTRDLLMSPHRCSLVSH